jgi:hypothetical protein
MDDTEEALNRQLENLERLMVSLDISGKSQVKIEPAETSGTKRPAEFEREFTKQKFQKVPPLLYIPLQNPFQGQGILDIDCSVDAAKDLRDWYNIQIVC